MWSLVKKTTDPGFIFSVWKKGRFVGGGEGQGGFWIHRRSFSGGHHVLPALTQDNRMVESLKSDKWAEARLSSHYQLPGRRFGSDYCSNRITPVFGFCSLVSSCSLSTSLSFSSSGSDQTTSFLKVVRRSTMTFEPPPPNCAVLSEGRGSKEIPQPASSGRGQTQLS